MEGIGSRAGAPAAALAGLGLLSALGYAWAAFGLAATNRAADVWAFLALFGGLFVLLAPALAAARRLARARPRAAAALLLSFAALFRLLLLFAGLPAEGRTRALARDLAGTGAGYQPFLLYDNDVWRYLWDGRVQAAGLSPYAFTPNEVEALVAEGEPRAAAVLAEDPWPDVFDHLSFRGHHTVYPPLAQLLFRGVGALAPGSVFAWKLALALLDLGTCVLLVALLRRLGRGPAEALLYAWNPLAVKEFAGSGHVDAAAVFLLTLTLFLLLARRPGAGLAAFAGAVLAKLSPAVLAGLVLRRAPARLWPVALLVGAASALPYARDLAGLAGGLAVYAREWTFNAGPWAALAWLAGKAGAADPAAWASALGGGVLLGLAVAVPLRDRGTDAELVGGAWLLLAALVLLAPAVMPWYLLWALPPAVLAGRRSWVVLTGLSLLSYLVYVDRTEHLWWRWLEFGVFFALWAREAARRPPAAD